MVRTKEDSCPPSDVEADRADIFDRRTPKIFVFFVKSEIVRGKDDLNGVLIVVFLFATRRIRRRHGSQWSTESVKELEREIRSHL